MEHVNKNGEKQNPHKKQNWREIESLKTAQHVKVENVAGSL
jgi:hypothetical protein